MSRIGLCRTEDQSHTNLLVVPDEGEGGVRVGGAEGPLEREEGVSHDLL